MRDLTSRLTNYFKASFPAIAIQTTEEQRAVSEVWSAAQACKRKLVTWSATEGMRELSGDSYQEIPDTEDLVAACKQRIKDAILIFRDVQTWPFDRDPILSRAMRELMQWAPTEGSGVVLIGPEIKPHPTMEKLIVVLDYTLPSPDDLRRVADGVAKSARKELKADDDVIRALSGLSTPEAENALALSLVERKVFDPSIIYREKVQAVRKSGLLDIIEADPRGLDSIGGLEELKVWINRRKRAYSQEAKDFGLPAPKGVLMVGVPGTGKSLSAKAIGTALGIPTLRWDIGSAFNSLVGESESRTRDTLELATALAPCVLWIDEIDKGLAGASGSGSGDSGVTRRVFGTVISWMQERTAPVFVVATANQVEGLPPEVLRKGRFDEIFAIDLPRDDERAAIFAIHLKRLKRDAVTVDDDLISATDGFTGSEIECLIYEGLFKAFEQGRELKTADMIDAAEATTPLSITAKEQIASIRKWAETRARFASARSSQSNIKSVRRFSSVGEDFDRASL